MPAAIHAHSNARVGDQVEWNVQGKWQLLGTLLKVRHWRAIAIGCRTFTFYEIGARKTRFDLVIATQQVFGEGADAICSMSGKDVMPHEGLGNSTVACCARAR